jgi:glyoxylase-like metal-dependent hydrolase (beta-lactamase superfamily II)
LPAPAIIVTGVNLEDHLGDIVRKARAMNGVAAAAAAAAAGISETELSELEETGLVSRRPDFRALANLIGLDAPKLEGIADGWRPAEKNQGPWRGLRAFTTAGEGLTVNCFLVWDTATRDAALFDTGFEAQLIRDTIAAEGLALRHIFITHSHFDHVIALGAIREAFPQARLHSSSKNAPADQHNKPGESVPLGGLRVTHRETPGHADDGVTYVIGNWPGDAPPVAIVGDAIFAGSIGRGNQSWDLAKQKVCEEIFTLPPETLICPGHGPLTTVAEEKAHNPFF